MQISNNNRSPITDNVDGFECVHFQFQFILFCLCLFLRRFIYFAPVEKKYQLRKVSNFVPDSYYQDFDIHVIIFSISATNSDRITIYSPSNIHSTLMLGIIKLINNSKLKQDLIHDLSLFLSSFDFLFLFFFFFFSFYFVSFSRTHTQTHSIFRSTFVSLLDRCADLFTSIASTVINIPCHIMQYQKKKKNHRLTHKRLRLIKINEKPKSTIFVFKIQNIKNH